MGGQSLKKIIIIIVIIIVAAGAYYVISPNINFFNGDNVRKRIVYHQSSNDPSPFIIEDNGTKLKVSIADSDGEREQGLSGIFGLDDDQGMLFVFDKPGYYQMWMKGMIFPLDIIWLDSNFNVITIRKNIDPTTFPDTFTSTSPAEYVLEINGGLSDKYGFKVGDQFDALDS